jgi:hypothetical protein
MLGRNLLGRSLLVTDGVQHSMRLVPLSLSPGRGSRPPKPVSRRGRLPYFVPVAEELGSESPDSGYSAYLSWSADGKLGRARNSTHPTSSGAARNA